MRYEGYRQHEQKEILKNCLHVFCKGILAEVYHISLWKYRFMWPVSLLLDVT
jgi:hypothetical protein